MPTSGPTDPIAIRARDVSRRFVVPVRDSGLRASGRSLLRRRTQG